MLTRAQAERAARALVEAEAARPTPAAQERGRTVDEAVEALRDRLAIEGARLSYRQNCESMHRVHISRPPLLPPARQRSHATKS